MTNYEKIKAAAEFIRARVAIRPVIGLVLGAGILVAVQKLPGLLKKRSGTKKPPKDRKEKAKKKTSDEVPSEDKVE